MRADRPRSPQRARRAATPRGPSTALTAATALALALAVACDDDEGGRAGAADAEAPPAASAAAEPLDYTPPPDSAIPDDRLGASIRRGRAIFVRTTDSLPAFAPGNIQCASCHLDAGRRPDAAPVVGVMARYPKYLERTGDVVTIHDRVNYCFTRSMAGTKLPSDSREMADMVAYLAFLSQGVPHGAEVRGLSMPKMPALTGDSARGAALYATTCVACHGAGGEGTPPLIPALWGPKSYSVGASMARQERAASFIRRFMPQTAPGTLTDQQAYDLAAYVNAQPRPDSPGKEDDWPRGGAPADVPYATAGHEPHRPPSRLLPRANAAGAVVPAPPSVLGGAGTRPVGDGR
jgi:thiosulfate dehydrogenase